ncbi:MAG TPA: oligosaccharide flippase family protein [Bryobacteraceae bacterium]|nr:oligosaccharide flippase family protein [Bryobacteraceae bacterium]
MRSRRVLTENILALGVLQMLNYAAPLITVPYLVRVLGPAHFGLVSFAQAVVLYFDFATDYGFNFSATRAIAACGEDVASVSRIFWATFCAKCMLMCGNGLLFALLVFLVPQLRQAAALLTVTFLYVFGTTMFPLWLFQGLERLKLAAALVGTARLFTVPALFLFVRGPGDYVTAGAIQGSVEAVAAVLALPWLVKRARLIWRKPSFSDVLASLKQGWPLFLSGAALFVSTSNATVILGFTAGQTQVGYFSAADKLIKAAVAALNPIGQALYPHLTGIKIRSKDRALRLIRKSFVAMGALALLISLVTFLFARPICTIVLGHTFAQSVSVLEWLAPLPFLLGLTNVLGTQTMLVFEMDRVFTRIMLRNVVVALPVMILASMFWGAIGAAAATSLMAALLVFAMAATLHAQDLPIWRNLFSKALPVTGVH